MCYNLCNMKFYEIKKGKRGLVPLLLLGDEQESMIERYLHRGRLFVLDDGGIVGACVVTDEGGGVLELKNIAVIPSRRRSGCGRLMIEGIKRAFGGQFEYLQAGTGDSPLTVPFYEACGFERSHRVENFFLGNYDHPIFEGGVQLKDMIYFKTKI